MSSPLGPRSMPGTSAGSTDAVQQLDAAAAAAEAEAALSSSVTASRVGALPASCCLCVGVLADAMCCRDLY